MNEIHSSKITFKDTNNYNNISNNIVDNKDPSIPHQSRS